MENLELLKIEVNILVQKTESIKKEYKELEDKRKSLLKKINDLECISRLETENTQFQKDVTVKEIEDLRSTIVKNSISPQRKCKFYNRGFCKYADSCNFFHPKLICELYLNQGVCQLQGCLKRHPKHCKYWCKKSEGCHRLTLCQYLHLESKRFKSNELPSIVDKHDEIYQCTICENKFASPGSLKNHIELCQKERSPFSCTNCEFKTESKEQFNLHIVQCIYSTLQENKNDNNATLEKDKKNYNEQATFSEVPLVTESENRHTCVNCSKTFKTLKGLKLHKTKTHCGLLKNDNYDCKLCNFKTVSKETLNKHVDKHIQSNKLNEKYFNLNFSLNNDTLTWNETGLKLQENAQIYISDYISEDFDDFEDQLAKFLKMWQTNDNSINDEQIEDISSSAIWHFETQEMECHSKVCYRNTQKICSTLFNHLGRQNE